MEPYQRNQLDILPIFAVISLFCVSFIVMIESKNTNEKDKLRTKISEQEETINKLMTENSVLRTLIKNEAEAMSWELRNQN